MVGDRRRSAVGILTTVALLALPACGSDGDSGDVTAPPAAVASPSVSQAPEVVASPAAAPTAAPSPDPVADGPGTAAASSITLTAEDLGEPWKLFSEGRGVEPPDFECSGQADEGAGDGLLGGGNVGGDTVQRGDDTLWITSKGLAFADEEAALRYVDAVRTDEFAECVAERYTRFHHDNGADPSTRFRVDAITDAEGEGDNGFELLIDLQFEEEVDGEAIDANGLVRVVFYRAGAVVLRLDEESAWEEGQSETLYDDAQDEWEAAVAQALGRAA